MSPLHRGRDEHPIRQAAFVCPSSQRHLSGPTCGSLAGPEGAIIRLSDQSASSAPIVAATCCTGGSDPPDWPSLLALAVPSPLRPHSSPE